MSVVLIGVVSVFLPLAVAFVIRMFAAPPPPVQEKRDVQEDAESVSSEGSEESVKTPVRRITGIINTSKF